MDTLSIHIVPALSDNYVYLLRDEGSGAVGVVDPGDAEPVRAALERLGWRPTHILLTHHHADHIAGMDELHRLYHPTIIGPRAERGRIDGMDECYGEGDTFRFGRQPVCVHEVPGHTSGHIAFWFPEAEALFCGDTLFSLGCGRLFEGTPAQMWDSLLKLRGLPDETRVYCGHEYTRSNARFARHVDPGNAALAERAEEVERLRLADTPTLPVTIAREKATNPFLRADDPALAAAMGLPGADPVAVFAALRQAKDTFR